MEPRRPDRHGGGAPAAGRGRFHDFRRAADHLARADGGGVPAEPGDGRPFSEHVTEPEARLAAASFIAPGSSLDTSEFVSDILATDGAARTGLGASAGAGRFTDEIAVVSTLRRPLAVVHGADEQLVSLDYLRKLTIPTLWRGEIQVLAGVGHAPHQEAPQQFAALLSEFLDDLGQTRPDGSTLS